MSSSAQQRQVEITVNDKTSDNVAVFQCDLSLLRSAMTYFEPLIKKQLQERQSEHSGPVRLKVNCDISIFRWLLAWTESGTKPKLTASNAVSIVLSSSFLGMHELTETALHYIKDHLAEVLLSGVDMDCVPGDLLGRLCAMATETSLANCLYTLYQKKEESHPNRGFVSALLRHWAAERLLLLLPEPSPSGTPFAAAKEGSGGGDDPSAATSASKAAAGKDRSNAKEAPSAADNGLRWCRICGVLYDERELRRLLANNGAALSSPVATKEPFCPGCHYSTGHPKGLPHARIGSRGEKFSTHAPSRLLPRGDNGDHHDGDSGTASPTAAARRGSVARSPLDVPPYTRSSTHQDLLVERWAWRLIGVTRFAVCRRCRRLVPLIDVATHTCSSNQVKAEFVPAERFGSSGGAGSTSMQNLIRWFEFAGKEGVYGEVGGLKPIVCPPDTVGLIEAETIAMPVCSGDFPGIQCTTNTAAGNGENGGGGGDTASTDTSQQQRQQQQRGRRRSSAGGAGYLEKSSVPCAWAEMPAAVAEVTAVASVNPNMKPILSTRPNCPVDVDVQNFHERQFFQTLEEQLSTLLLSASATPKGEKLSAAAAAVGAASNCPMLCSFPYVAPLSAPSSFSSSPRPAATTVLGINTGNRVKGGSLVLGSSLQMAKPSARKKHVSSRRK